MIKSGKFWAALLLPLILLTSLDADAARMGGGRSIGRQSGQVTQRQAATPPARQPAEAVPQQGRSATPAGTPATTAARRPWAGVLGGLAAGLGLAWLAHSLGLGAAFGQVLLFALVAIAVIALFGWLRRSRPQPASSAEDGAAPLAFQGAGAGPAVADAPRTYNPEKIGNDASARPWETQPAHFDGNARGAMAGGLGIGSALGAHAAGASALDGSQTWGVPAGFDAEGFLSAAKRNFVTLQHAWDNSDIASLRSMMTDEMLVEIRSQLAEREAHTGQGPNKTEVVMLDAKLLGIEDVEAGYLASVEFSGMIREEPSAGPSPFREVWNMTKPKDGSLGWLVAGVQALQ